VRIGIDLGGTKIEAVSLASDGSEGFRRRIATPRGDYDATIEAVAGLVADAERTAGRASVGVGIPGVISPATGLVKNANSTWLNGRPFVEDLERALARPIRVANDADCFALSEATDGAAAGATVVFGVIVGTGTGGGVVVGGRLCAGPNAIAGEWGHNMLPWPRDGEWPGPPCYCGRTGCIETFLSGPAFERDYLASARVASAAGASTGESVASSIICARAAQGEAVAREVLARYEDRMARGLASIINVLDPDVIVLGGGMSNIGRLYQRVPQLWPSWIFSDQVATRLVRAAHGDSSGVRGAAWLWRADEI
jgi:fructokinase